MHLFTSKSARAYVAASLLIILATGTFIMVAFKPARAAADGEGAPFSRIAEYLGQFGFDPMLPALSVSFDQGRVTIHDGRAKMYGYTMHPVDNRKATFLRLIEGPNITWPAEMDKKYSVIFTDMGPPDGLTTIFSTFFPYIHSFWTDCTGGSITTCKLGAAPQSLMKTEYKSPGNFGPTPNRYTFLLFEAPISAQPLTLEGISGVELATKLYDIRQAALPTEPGGQPALAGDQSLFYSLYSFVIGFDFGRFFEENPDYKAIRWNYMMVGSGFEQCESEAWVDTWATKRRA